MPSIKSDRWIRQQCLVPKYVRIVNGVPRALSVPPTFEENLAIQHCERNQLSRPLSPAEVEMIINRGMVLRYDENVQSMYPWLPMIEPFSPYQIREKGGGLIDPPADEEPRHDFDFEMRSYRAPMEKIISYGTSSYGYDIRCSREFKVFTNINSTIVDPKNFDEKSFVDMEGDYCIIPPNSFALARTMEYFRIPRDVLTICLGKSTYARCGIVVNVTPFEPEWEGHVTLEFSNTTPLPAKIYAGEGCAQVLFFQGDEPCEVSYKDRGGKYQGQVGVTVPRT